MHSIPNLDSDTFDYIIVGAGSAGTILAWELAKRENTRVLVVESGTRKSHLLSSAPALYPHLFQHHHLSNSTLTSPQVQFANRRIPLPLGKGVGGSSLINAMIWQPPHTTDFLEWNTILNDAWAPASFEKHLSYLERLFSPEQPSAEISFHASPSLQQLVSHSNSSHPSSLGFYRRSTRHGKRLTPWMAYSSYSSQRQPSLLKGTFVQKILFENDRACGLLVWSGQSTKQFILRANRAIIVSSGAIHSPALLMRSGIGPSDVLQEVGIRQVYNAPKVGTNLQDHLVFPIISHWHDAAMPSRFTLEEWNRWRKTGAGPLSSNLAEAGAFLSLSSSNKFQLNPPNTASPARPEFQWHITPTHYLEYPTRDVPTNAISIGVTQLHPRSRGSVTIDLQGEPVVDPNYWETAEDKEQLRDAVQWTRNWLEQFRGQFPLGEEILPGVKRTSSAQIDAALARFTTTIYHYAGTCAVGTDPDSTCAPNFQVRGCEGLYVCDASSLPTLPSGNTQVPVMLLALHLARLIEG